MAIQKRMQLISVSNGKIGPGKQEPKLHKYFSSRERENTVPFTNLSSPFFLEQKVCDRS